MKFILIVEAIGWRQLQLHEVEQIPPTVYLGGSWVFQWFGWGWGIVKGYKRIIFIYMGQQMHSDKRASRNAGVDPYKMNSS